jgi:S1-C subfamily serine protease
VVATLLIAAVVLVHNGLSSSNTTATGQAGTQFTVPPSANSGNSGSTGSGSTGSGSSGAGSSNGSGSALSTEAITAAVEPGVVDIDTRLGYQAAAAAGTGMILSSNGYVLTNNHVIDGATSITATVVGTGRTYTATVVGTDVSQDVAVLRLTGASGLTTVPLGDSSTVSTGDNVVAIGNAGGTGGDPTVVTGSVTDLNQSITASDENGTNAEQLSGLIVTNAPIVAGDSGGPLVSDQGKVIGINTAASANNQFMSANSTGFAIPINKALSIAKQIEDGNETDTIHIGATGFLGIAMAPPTGSANGSGNSTGTGTGSTSPADDPPTVSTVIAGSPADKAGITAGDTITAFDGTSVSTAEGLQNLTHRRHPGDKVSISWTDTSGQSHTATVTLATGPAA